MTPEILLGSNSIHKLEAVRKACKQVGLETTVTGLKTASGQNEQPVGWDETYAGAFARASAAQKADPEAIAIGIESGIMRFNEKMPITLDIAIIVILTPDCREIVSSSPGIRFPEECVLTAQTRGFDKCTVGSVIQERFGGDATDPHWILSNGKVRREATLVNALEIALHQI
ncbi:MAG: DUF84 family protein [Patescibacteria group bacterium]